MEFTSWAAQFVAERIWSQDQSICRIDNSRILLTFTASSREELIGWILSFGEEAKVIGPAWLADTIIQKVQALAAAYKVGLG